MCTSISGLVAETWNRRDIFLFQGNLSSVPAIQPAVSCLQPIVRRWQRRRPPVVVRWGVGVAPEVSMVRALRALREVVRTDDRRTTSLVVLNNQQLLLLLKRASVDARFNLSQFESYQVQPQQIKPYHTYGQYHM